jgi:hypothetical protein
LKVYGYIRLRGFARARCFSARKRGCTRKAASGMRCRRTMKLYDRTQDEVTLDEVERIMLK